MKRISKRYGTRPGIKIKRYQRLAVAVDTSGSIKENDFVIFFNEIHSMWKQGAEIVVLECDAEVKENIHTQENFRNILVEVEELYLIQFLVI